MADPVLVPLALLVLPSHKKNRGNPWRSETSYLSIPKTSTLMPSCDGSLDPKLQVNSFALLTTQIASSANAGPNKHRPTASSKLRYTLSKPKPTYPPATSLAGLGMRELLDEEIEEAYERRGLVRSDADKGEKWFSFEHSGNWREVERQFMGAVRSHGEVLFG
jgi:hypothetical protein